MVLNIQIYFIGQNIFFYWHLILKEQKEIVKKAANAKNTDS